MSPSRVIPPLMLAALVLLGARRAGAAPEVSATVNTQRAYRGEAVQLQVTVRDFQDLAEPKLPDIPGAEVKYVGPSDSTMTRIINNRRWETHTRTFTYSVTPREQGRLTIPAITVLADGQEYHTRKIAINVAEDAPVFVRVTTPVERAYVHQRIPLNADIWVRQASSGRLQLSAEHMHQILDMTSDRSPLFSLFPVPQQYSTRTKTDAQGREQTYYVFETSTDYAPETPGTLSLSGYPLVYPYPTSFSRNIFGRIELNRTRTLRVTPEALSVEVRPLPSENRPPSFAGAVGRVKIAASAKPVEVRVGDPIELSIEITGNVDLETLGPPALQSQPALTQRFRIPDEQLGGRVAGDRKVFTQMIRVKHPGVTEIPPIEYPYFDPVAGEYRLAESMAIPLDVTGNESLESEELIADEAEAPAAQPTPVVEGLHENVTDPAALLERSRPVQPLTLVLGMTLPALAFVVYAASTLLAGRAVTAGALRRRAQREAARQLRQARSLQPARAAGRIRGALADYLALRSGHPAAAFTARDGETLLLAFGATPQIAALWRELIERCDAAEYSGVSADSRALTAEAERLLSQLDRHSLEVRSA